MNDRALIGAHTAGPFINAGTGIVRGRWPCFDSDLVLNIRRWIF